MKLALLGISFSIAAASMASAAEVEFMNSGSVLPTTLPFSEIVRVDDTLYLSGQLGNLPGTLDLAEGGMDAEAQQVMENIRTSLEANGYTMENLVKCVVFLEDMAEWGAFNEIYQTFFEDGRFPARSAFGSSGLAFNARVEVECTGAVQ